jgi:cell division protein FtsW (lipid II flippase)
MSDDEISKVLSDAQSIVDSGKSKSGGIKIDRRLIYLAIPIAVFLFLIVMRPRYVVDRRTKKILWRRLFKLWAILVVIMVIVRFVYMRYLRHRMFNR